MHKDTPDKISKTPELVSGVHTRGNVVYAGTMGARQALEAYIPHPVAPQKVPQHNSVNTAGAMRVVYTAAVAPVPQSQSIAETWTDTPTVTTDTTEKVVDPFDLQPQTDLTPEELAVQQARQRLQDVWDGKA